MTGTAGGDKLAKTKIVLRELKETRFGLRVLRRAGSLGPAQEPLGKESDELVKIVASIIRKCEGSMQR